MATKRADRIKQLRAIVDAERKRIFQHAEPQRDSRKARIMHCGECLFSWDDSVSTDYTPTPSGRCPFEYVHKEVRELRTLGKRAIKAQWLHRADCPGEEGWDNAQA